jgi:hypothetical protein
MKFGYLHDTGRRYDPPAFAAEKRSGSPELRETTLCESEQQIRNEAVRYEIVSQRLRLNST